MQISQREKAFFSISLIAIGAFFAVAIATVNPSDWPFSGEASFRGVRNLSGPLGSLLAFACFRLFGSAFAWFVPLGVLLMGAAAIAGNTRMVGKRLLKALLIVIVFNTLFALSSYTSEFESLSGYLGRAVSLSLSAVFGEIGSTILLIACVLLLILSELGRTLSAMAGLVRVAAWMPRYAFRFLRGLGPRIARSRAAESKGRIQAAGRRRRIHRPPAEEPTDMMEAPTEPPWADAVPAESAPVSNEPFPGRAAAKSKRRVEASGAVYSGASEEAPERIPISEASLPSMSILEDTQEEDGIPYSQEELKNWSSVLEEKLRNYNIEGRVTAVRHGPIVTTFEFEPAPGVKVREIVSRADDLALALRAKSLRLIAPIPGRAVVGIEIANPESRTVRFRQVLKEIPERMRLGGIIIALGVDVVGKPFLMDLCSAPHLLVAGTTGSGKSVCLNGIISSILFQHNPSDVRMIIVDPKMVEMNIFNGIPHLLHPVITDAKTAARIFSHLTLELERRNELFRESGVKNIESYNSKIALGKMKPGDRKEKLPYIILVIDELGDLTLAKGVDIETFLSKISNMARAVGMHMVVATQRPSVDVIVGKTKANFPARIAFRVASKVDSRTILDSIGAEKLIGRGDMLYMDSRRPEPIRLHGAFISEGDLERLVSHWKSFEFEASSIDLFRERDGAPDDEDRDPLFSEAKEIILRYRQGSTSLLQRKLHIGYARAARLLDQMEQAGFVGPPDGSKPREVYMEEGERISPRFDD